MNKSPRNGEAIMQKVVLDILNGMPNGEATIEELLDEVPNRIKLTKGDLEPSPTRTGEKKWEQIVRNIRSHSDSSKNYISKGYIEEIDGGYSITALGRTKA